MIGLLFTGGEGPYPDMLKHYLENSLYSEAIDRGDLLVAAADSGAALALDCGFIPQTIIGDMDSIDSTTLKLLKRRGASIVEHSRDKDDSDTVLGLRMLRQAGADSVILAGGGGGRLDHLLAIVQLMEGDEAPQFWLTAQDVIYRVSDPAAFSIRPQADLSVFPFQSDSLSLQSEGLEWELNGFALTRGRYSLSNRSPGGRFKLSPADDSQNRGVAALIASQKDDLFQIEYNHVQKGEQG